jgi:hypothetical protein
LSFECADPRAPEECIRSVESKFTVDGGEAAMLSLVTSTTITAVPFNEEKKVPNIVAIADRTWTGDGGGFEEGFSAEDQLRGAHF